MLLMPLTHANAENIVSITSSFHFTMPDWIVNLFAKTEANTYTIVFDWNWNTNTNHHMENQIVIYDIETPLVANEYLKAWYTFTGWNMNPLSSEVLYANKSTVRELAFSWEVTLYAVWQANTDTKYTVQHYQQNPNDNNYTLIGKDTKQLSWTTDTRTQAQANTYEGFRAQAIHQENINWDESTVVKIYYDRVDYSITFDSNWGPEVVPVNARYWKTIIDNKPVNPTKQWYEFSDWNPQYPESMPLYWTSLQAVWTPSTTTPYTVEHYIEQLDGSYNLRETEHLIWTTDSLTNAVAKNYSWFSEKNIQQTTINANGSSIAKVYYSRNTYKVSYISSWVVINTWEFKYEETILRPEITRPGYQFNGWSWAVTMPAENTVLEALWIPKNDTKYTVKHYLQNIENNNYIERENEQQEMTWTTEGLTNVIAKMFQWFTAQPVQQVVIEWDGSSVVSIYYTRNVYTITFDSNWWTAVNSLTWKYETPLTSPWAPSKLWYDFASWSPEFPSIMPAWNLTLTAVWTPRSDTQYKVEHYLEKLNWSYWGVADYWEKETWVSDELTHAEPRTIAWYTADPIQQEIINGNGTTVVKIYYKRNLYNVYYDANWGTTPETLKLKFGASIPKDIKTIRTWYVFISWMWDNTVPANDVTLTAQWEYANDTEYRLRHQWQNADNDNYILHEEEILTWTTESDAIVIAKSYDWFKTPYYETKKIAADWSTIIDVFYDRKDYTITFNTNWWSAVPSITRRYWALMPTTGRPLLQWYLFDTWEPEYPTRMPLNWWELTAQWKPSQYTPYTVYHYVQKLWNDSEYSLRLEENLNWVTDSQTQIEWKDFPWFSAILPIQQTVIRPDGTSYVNVYYTRNSYEIIPEKWKWVESIDGAGFYKYQSVIILTAHAKTGYTFTWWLTSKDFEVNIPDHAIIVNIQATPNTYRIEYHPWEWFGAVYTQEFVYDITSNIQESNFTYSWHILSWWIDEEGNTYKKNQEILSLIPNWKKIFTAQWKPSSVVRFMDGEVVYAELELWIWDDITYPENPQKNNYVFKGWNWVPEDWKVPEDWLLLSAIWEYQPTGSNSWNWWWGSSWWAPSSSGSPTSSSVTTQPTEQSPNQSGSWTVEENQSSEVSTGVQEDHNQEEHQSAEVKSDAESQEVSKEWWVITQEVKDAYQWAYENKITTLSPVEIANPDWYVYRWHMAKMVVNYATNVLWWKLPSNVPIECMWNDGESDRESKEISDYAVKSCSLWLMWINTEYYKPNDYVTRAQFGTVLSRMLWWVQYNQIDTKEHRFYEKHLKALKENDIMKQIENPELRLELRKRVWVMLKRTWDSWDINEPSKINGKNMHNSAQNNKNSEKQNYTRWTLKAIRSLFDK